MKVLVTGAKGFVGRALIDRIISDGLHEPIAAIRQKNQNTYFDCPVIETDEIEWCDSSPPHFLKRIDVIIHAAARVHVMQDMAVDPLLEFHRVNVDETIRLARHAAKAGVRRFIFLSSLKVNGEHTHISNPFTADQPSAPCDPYALSKYRAEVMLRALSEETGMEVVVIRPPLVYGPGVKANFLSMMNFLWRGIPLPLGSVKENRRSFIFIDNLVSVIIICIRHPAAANQTFLVSDDEDLSTTGLLERMALALGRPSRLVAVPIPLILLAVKLVGRSDIAQRLFSSLQADIKKTKDLLGWSPLVSVDEGLRQTATHFLKVKS